MKWMNENDKKKEMYLLYCIQPYSSKNTADYANKCVRVLSSYFNLLCTPLINLNEIHFSSLKMSCR